MVQPNLDVLDANSILVNVNTINPNGRGAATASQPVAVSTEDKAVLDAIAASLAGALTIGLPPDAATETTLSGISTLITATNTALDGINTSIVGNLTVSGFLTPDDAAFAATSSVGVLSATSSNTDLTLTSGRAQPLTVTTDGDLKVTLAGEDITVAGTVTVDGTVNAVPWDGSDSLTFEAGSDAISNSAMRMPTAGSLLLFNGTSFDRARGSIADGLLVNLGANNDVTVASLPLPAGASTSAKQDTIIAAIDTLETIFTDVIGFETTSNLTSAATYSSGLLSLSPPYSQVLTNILSDRTGTVNIYWYSDAGGTDLVRTLTIAYTAGDGFLSFGAPAFTKYVKYEFTNSAGASTTDFYYTTKFLTKPVNPQIATLNAPLSNGMVGAVTRSVLTGVTTGGGGSFVNVKVNPSGTLETNATLAAGTALVGKVGIDQATANANEVVTKTGSTTAVTGTVAVSGTFWQATQPVSLASVPTHAVTVASGGVAAGAFASGALASGSVASGAVASGAFASGALASGSIAAGAIEAGATSIAANEDDASANLDRGVKVMARRTATPANTSGTDLDYEMFQINAGRLWTSTLLTDGTTTAGVIVANNALKTDASSINGTTIVTGGVAGSQSVGGTVATNVAITDNPINTGGQAVSSENTAVTTGRKVQAVFDLVGKQIVLPYANPENFVSGVTASMTGTTSTSLIASPGAGLRNYITSITVSNAHASVGTDVNIQDGSGGTTIWVIPAASIYGGGVVTFPTPLRQPTTATALFCANATTGASTRVSAAGYKGA